MRNGKHLNSGSLNPDQFRMMLICTMCNSSTNKLDGLSATTESSGGRTTGAKLGNFASLR